MKSGIQVNLGHVIYCPWLPRHCLSTRGRSGELLQSLRDNCPIASALFCCFLLSLSCSLLPLFRYTLCFFRLRSTFLRLFFCASRAFAAARSNCLCIFRTLAASTFSIFCLRRSMVCLIVRYSPGAPQGNAVFLASHCSLLLRCVLADLLLPVSIRILLTVLCLWINNKSSCNLREAPDELLMFFQNVLVRVVVSTTTLYCWDSGHDSACLQPFVDESILLFNFVRRSFPPLCKIEFHREMPRSLEGRFDITHSNGFMTGDTTHELHLHRSRISESHAANFVSRRSYSSLKYIC